MPEMGNCDDRAAFDVSQWKCSTQDLLYGLTNIINLSVKRSEDVIDVEES